MSLASHLRPFAIVPRGELDVVRGGRSPSRSGDDSASNLSSGSPFLVSDPCGNDVRTPVGLRVPKEIPKVGNKVTAIIAEVENARKGIAACAVFFLALAGLCFAFSERVLLVLVRLLGKKLVSYSPEEGFIALASLSLYCAVVLTLPAAGYLLWRRQILPRVPGWRRWGGPIIALAAALFSCGVLLGYFVLLPAGIGFLVGFETHGVVALISAKKFISFCGTC